MEKHEDRFSTADIFGNLNISPLFEDPLNNPNEIKKRLNQELNDIDFCLFIIQMIILQNCLTYIWRQQEKLNHFYNRKWLYKKELEEFFINSLR